jgi:2-keto-4-pentenoate hydratase/2-oxohepta-3-ene-1,7-dioic acid hydratase in catechol pathway
MTTRKKPASAESVMGAKHARIQTDAGVLEGEYDDGTVHSAAGTFEPDEYELLAPCEPSAFYCVGWNFSDKVEQTDREMPEEPDFFIKPPVSLHDPVKPIQYPSFTSELSYAGELAAVIETECTNLTADDVDDVVRGYTILNDLDCLDQQGRTARKAFDGSGPLGPVITDVDPIGLEMTTRVNGEIRQQVSTDRLVFKPREVISFLSERFTLAPGDVVSFGSPASPGLLEPGDEIEIHFEEIGTLRNTVE